jgi:hypothetical protein
VHQVGFSLHDYIEMQGQPNIKLENIIGQEIQLNIDFFEELMVIFDTT